MKFKFIFRTFIASLFITSFIGVFQFSRFIEADTGFLVMGNNKYGFFLSVVILGVIFLVSLASVSVRRCPLKQPSVKIPISSVSFFISVVLILKIIISVSSESVNYFVIISDCICMLYFILYAARAYLVVNISEYFSVVPLFYWIFNLVISYLEISKIKIIPENAYMILATASNALFMLYYSKLCCKVKDNNIHKKILVSGVIASNFDFVFSISGIYMSITEKQKIIHNNPLFMCVYLFTGIFIVLFIKNFFSNKNLAASHSHSGSRNIIPHEISDDSSDDNGDMTVKEDEKIIENTNND